jgi:hypothetical protein
MSVKTFLECLGFVVAVVAICMVIVVIVLELKPYRQTNIYGSSLEDASFFLQD